MQMQQAVAADGVGWNRHALQQRVQPQRLLHITKTKSSTATKNNQTNPKIQLVYCAAACAAEAMPCQGAHLQQLLTLHLGPKVHPLAQRHQPVGSKLQNLAEKLLRTASRGRSVEARSARIKLHSGKLHTYANNDNPPEPPSWRCNSSGNTQLTACC